MSLTCPQSGQLLNRYCVLQPNGYMTATNCGQFAQCTELITIETHQKYGVYGCCRQGYLYLNAAQIIVYIIIIPVIGVGILGALGGGVVKRPFLEATLNFNAQTAGDMTMCLQFGSQLLNIIIIFFQRHPEAEERPIINFEIALIYSLAIPFSQALGAEFANYLPLGSLLWIQNLFFIAITPILYYYGAKELTLERQKKLDTNLLNKSQLVAINSDNDYLEEKQTYLYKKFYDDASNKFPLVTILITVFNFAINESIILTRTTPGLTSPYYDKSNTSKGECQPWNFYMLLLLFSVNLVITLAVYYFKRKEEYTKDAVKFFNYERYYTPGTRFWKIYAAGWVTGIVAGFFGMAAGLIMLVTMVHFGLISAVAGGTANFCYFIICLQLFSTVLANQSASDDFKIGYQFFFYGLGIVSVASFTNLGYYYLKKYNIGHVLFYIDFAIVLLNIAGNVAWGLESAYRGEGYRTLMSSPNNCGTIAADI